IDRRSEKRDDATVAAALAEPAARFYLFHGDKVMLRGTDPLFTVGEAANLGLQRAEAILLGWAKAGPRLAGVIPEAVALPEGAASETDLRGVATEAAVTPDHIGALAQARSLLNWHQRHRFCSVCGSPSAMKIGGYRRDCPACGAEHFPRTDPVVIMLTIDGDRCLLGRQQRFLPGMYSCLAGFLEPGETVEDAVRRETHEESGIKVGRVRYHASQPWPFPSSLMIGCHAEALSRDITRDEVELDDCRWFPRAEVRAMLAGTHPDGLKAPQPVAIAHHLIRFWAEAG
ncbi:MAG: NAD(+) diphosphatase, partial [Rhizobiales bacterium]|nr:NAD(+) diphosphatase [Hyphomicrobiales bacterium]